MGKMCDQLIDYLKNASEEELEKNYKELEHLLGKKVPVDDMDKAVKETLIKIYDSVWIEEAEDVFVTKASGLMECAFRAVAYKTTQKACNAFCHTACPHKTDSFDCLKNKCSEWKAFKKMMEE